MAAADDIEHELLARLGEVLPLVARHAEAANRDRRPSREVMTAMGERGLLRLVVPEHYGGYGVHAKTFLRIVSAIAQVDGSTAWTVMTCNEEAGIASAYVEPATVASLITGQPATVVAGSGVPKGRAARADGGWEVTGRWDFVSGCTASDYVVLSAIVADATLPQVVFVLVPTADVVIDDTWNTVGLRGTGSNDVVLDRHFVPDEWSGVNVRLGPAIPDTPFYRLPSSLRFPFPKVGVASGLARAAIDEFVALASGKRPLFHRGNLAERPTAQAAMARAEALLSSGLAWVLETHDDLWAIAAAGGEVGPDVHARCRLACSHAVVSSIDAIETVCLEAGSTANFAGSPLPRLLADARAVSGHFMAGPYQMQTAGRVLLGLSADDPNF